MNSTSSTRAQGNINKPAQEKKIYFKMYDDLTEARMFIQKNVHRRLQPNTSKAQNKKNTKMFQSAHSKMLLVRS